ncbi:chorismate mutase [Rhodococcus chondri]|uniref:Chorismate mutase n=1 Tax=Rhodococcus chondri TaxID=3065941 RepID=A0ABU7JYN3_9NOCA|nr:chorismate mutase [Rhodococcus sp. CC-R104]MEE2035034.1 chorismate mutase [Rhodococcus sp. CC-R104]
MTDRNPAASRTTTAPTPETELEALRAELDRVDRALLDDIRDRMALCAHVARLKQRHDIAVLQPGRMQLVHRRAQDYAQRHGLSGAFVQQLYTLLIDEACRVEDRIVAGDGGGAAGSESGESRR